MSWLLRAYADVCIASLEDVGVAGWPHGQCLGGLGQLHRLASALEAGWKCASECSHQLEQTPSAMGPALMQLQMFTSHRAPFQSAM